MNIRQLEIFTAVAESGSFTGAAKILNMAQPAVSIAIRKLEDELNHSLLSRGEQVVPTAEGEVLLEHAVKLLGGMQAARQQMADLNNLQYGEVRFSTSAMLGSYFFLPYIKIFRQQYPEISLRVVNEGTHGARQLFEEGATDMAVVNMDDLPEGVEAVPLTRQEVVACVSKSHALAKAKSLKFEEFALQPLVLYRENYALRRLVDSLSLHFQVVPEIVMETDLLGMILGMVSAGDGVTIGLRAMTDSEPDLVSIPFDEPIWLSLGIAWKRGKYLSVANRTFVDFLVGHQS